MTPVLLVALAPALLLAWRWRPRQGLEPGVAWLLVAYVVLGVLGGALSIAPPAWQPHWMRLAEPSVMYGTLAAVLLTAQLRSAGYPVKAILGSQFVLSQREWALVNLGLGVACLLLALINVAVVVALEPEDWEAFKWSCMVNLAAAFFLRATFVWVDLVARAGQAAIDRWRSRAGGPRGHP